MKRLFAMNLIASVLLAISFLAMAWFEREAFLPLLFFMAVVLGLALVNLAAPIFLWKRHGVRSLLLPPTLVAAVYLCTAVSYQGYHFALASTPAAPGTFLRPAIRSDLEALAHSALANGMSDSLERRLREYGFSTTAVDSARQVVTFGHYRMRNWHEYLYAVDGLTANEYEFDRQLQPHWYYRSH